MSTPPEIASLYQQYCGAEPVNAVALTGSASTRRYIRLSGPIDIIATIGTDVKENQAFIYLATRLKEQGINVPRVLAVDSENMCYLQEDVGDQSLYDLIRQEGFTDGVITLCRQSLDELSKFQRAEVDYTCCFPVPAMDSRSIAWDLNYFKYCFLKPSGIDIDEVCLQEEFDVICDAITGLKPTGLIHRDFQSRNIQVKDNALHFIDFQGARRGPVLYDVVSFLWQARAGFPQQLKEELANYYMTLNGIDREEGWRAIEVLIVFRMLQVLGAYGFRGLVERKEAFITPIAVALGYLSRALGECDLSLPHLTSLVELLTLKFEPKTFPAGNLTVTVYSFSYRRGIPTDPENGGGFVFDCRALHNPGRYEQYKTLTGNDRPVIEFLEERGEIQPFLEHCKALVDASVERYLSRGFTSLVVAFGCTGGQHRSVYSANAMARHLAVKYNVHIILNHREQSIRQEFNAPQQ